MEALAFEKIMEYGVIGLGWVIALLMYKRNTNLQDRLMDLAVETNATLTLLAERLK
jgi:hypothetical protein